jgi:hypothetical protein
VTNGVITTPGRAKITVDAKFYIPDWDPDQTYPGDGFGGQYNERYLVRYKGSVWATLIGGNKGNPPDTSPLQWRKTTKWHFVNGGAGMTSNDIGRLVRIFNEPSPWDDTVSYQPGQVASLLGEYWKCIAANTNSRPGTDAVTWVAQPANVAKWEWGTISAVVETDRSDFQIVFPQPLWYLGRVTNWRLGRYYGQHQPSTGVFYEGRLWLSGDNNQFDASVALGVSRFSPSTWFGAVQDDSAISETLDAESSQPILWFRPTSKGLIMGTCDGEWKVEASAQDDVITPTSIQARNESIFGSANIDPVLAGVVPVFVHRSNLFPFESLRDTYSDQMISLNLAEMAKSLTESGIINIAYTRNQSPMLWCALKNGELAATTYRRDKLRMFTVEPPALNGWHHHKHGYPGRKFMWVSPYKSLNNNGDGLAVVTKDPASGYNRIEFLRDQMLETDTVFRCNYLDGGPANLAPHFAGKTIHITTTPGKPAKWVVPGWTLVQECPLNGLQADLQVVRDAGVNNNFVSALAAGAVIAQNTKVPYLSTAIPGLQVWVSPPADGGGGGCGAFGFTNNGTWPGQPGSAIPPPGFPDHFVIWYASGDTAFGSTKWYPFQYWQRNPGATDPAIRPVWHPEVPPTTTITESDNPATGVNFSGLWRWNGQLLRVFLCGLDLGEQPVINGVLNLPYGLVPEFTHERVQQTDALKQDWKDLTITLNGYNIPGIIGYMYDSRGQLLSPYTPAETGAQQGPAFAKKKRAHKYGVKVYRSQTFSIGTGFDDTMQPAILAHDDMTPIGKTDLFTGIHKDTLEDDSKLEMEFAWQSTGPYPLNVTAAGAFLETQDE